MRFLRLSIVFVNYILSRIYFLLFCNKDFTRIVIFFIKLVYGQYIIAFVCYNFNGKITNYLFFVYVTDGLRETYMEGFLTVCSDR